MTPQPLLGPDGSHVNRSYLQDGQGFPYRPDPTGQPGPYSSWEEDPLQEDDTGYSHSTPSSTHRAKSKPVVGYAPVHDDSSEPNSAPKATDKHSWTMEISTMALCLAAVVTSTVLLFYADGRPLTDYNFFISFNTLISILSAIARATLAFAVGSCLGQWKWNWFSRRSGSPAMFASFEDASRGPWGSFWLLCRLRARHWAAIGALVTLLMLGFEPFMQAIIYYEGRMITTDQPQTSPSIGASHRLDVGSTKMVKPGAMWGFKLGNETHSMVSGDFRKEASAGLAAAVYRGFYAHDPRDAVAFTCGTGNCTWTVFTSLAVCSACRDVSDRVEVRGRNGTDLGNIKVHGFHTEGHYISHALPYVNLTNLARATYVGISGRRRAPQFQENMMAAAYMSAAAVSNPGLTLTFGELNTMLVAVGLIQAEPAYANHSKPWNQTRSTATECALYLCTNAYRSEVSGGKLKEDVVASWSNRVPGTYHPRSNQSMTESWAAYEKHTNYSLNTGSAYYALDDLQLRIPKAEAEQHHLPADAPLLFNITQNTLGSLLPFLAGFFQDPLVYGESDIGPIISQTLHNSPDLSATFAGAAAAMSHWLRDNTGDASSSQTGEQREWTLHIRVRWPYVTLPVLVVLLGCAFVFLSIWATRRRRLPPWKTDVLATLTHSLDAGTREELRAAARQGRMQDRARGMVLHFEDTGKGLELKTHDQHPTT